MNTAIIYNIANAKNVKIIGLASPALIKKATENVKADNACWFGLAAVMSGGDALIWEY